MKKIYIGIDSRLDDHLVGGQHLRRQGLGRFRPQQLDVGVERHALQPYGECRYRQDAHEEKLPSVCIEDAAQSTQLSLNSATNPQNAAISVRLALEQSTACNRPPKKRTDVRRPPKYNTYEYGLLHAVLCSRLWAVGPS